MPKHFLHSSKSIGLDDICMGVNSFLNFTFNYKYCTSIHFIRPTYNISREFVSNRFVAWQTSICVVDGITPDRTPWNGKRYKFEMRIPHCQKYVECEMKMRIEVCASNFCLSATIFISAHTPHKKWKMN